MQQKIVPSLWFDTEAEEAAEFYVSVFEDGRVVDVTHYTDAGPRPAGTVMTVEFELRGQRFVGINGGPEFKFDEAVSFQIVCETQDEVDYFWERLSEGGEEGQCGWLKDRYCLSWQVVPTGMGEIFADPDPERAQRAMKAMLGMRKIDVDACGARPTAREPTAHRLGPSKTSRSSSTCSASSPSSPGSSSPASPSRAPAGASGRPTSPCFSAWRGGAPSSSPAVACCCSPAGSGWSGSRTRSGSEPAG